MERPNIGAAPSDEEFLVRPDGYIGFKSSAGNASLLEAHLHRTLRA